MNDGSRSNELPFPHTARLKEPAAETGVGVTDPLLQGGSFRAAHTEPAQTVGSVRAGRPRQLLIQLDSILTGCDISATEADRRGSGSVVVVSVKGERIRLGTQVEVIIHHHSSSFVARGTIRHAVSSSLFQMLHVL